MSLIYVQVFFPVIVSNHFFLLVFNLNKKSIHIIDNSAAKVDYEVKYKEICELIKSLFEMHLKEHNHPAYEKISKIQRPFVMGIKWKTHGNGQDCGVFTMLHMEQYAGQIVSKWDCGLDVEGPTQRLQLIRLRIKFVAKLILHEFNVRAESVHDMAEQFSSLHNKDDIKVMIKNSISNHSARLKDPLSEAAKDFQ